ncbi:MBL fold metallo-hydrolase [Nonomuraea sp. NPDC050663]|uniref:MBL fold metallo-hydrolase n=1 Tax=Nonomuraea sp. NPDC050663 TaxID=3364370 RepID=UPI0037A0017C
MTERWQEIADRLYIRRHQSANLTIGLVLGDDHCLVVDTRASHRHAAELIRAIREVTPTAWTVVNTHAHWDHCFGNAPFAPAEIWGHVLAVKDLDETGELQRSNVLAFLPEERHEEIREVAIVPPTHTFADRATLDIGGREVHLRYFGRGHTDHDIVVHVPDVGTAFVGDLIEEVPYFGDSFPLDWPVTLHRMLQDLDADTFVPGHGAAVTRQFVERQQADLAWLAEYADYAYRSSGLRAVSMIDAAFPEDAQRMAFERAFQQLDGQLP